MPTPRSIPHERPVGTQGRLELVVRHDDPQDVDALRAQVAARAELPLEAVSELRVKRRVIDARRRIGEPVYRLTVDVALDVAGRRAVSERGPTTA